MQAGFQGIEWVEGEVYCCACETTSLVYPLEVDIRAIECLVHGFEKLEGERHHKRPYVGRFDPGAALLGLQHMLHFRLRGVKCMMSSGRHFCDCRMVCALASALRRALVGSTYYGANGWLAWELITLLPTNSQLGCSPQL